jgi:hypothetical protein
MHAENQVVGDLDDRRCDHVVMLTTDERVSAKEIQYWLAEAIKLIIDSKALAVNLQEGLNGVLLGWSILSLKNS